MRGFTQRFKKAIDENENLKKENYHLSKYNDKLTYIAIIILSIGCIIMMKVLQVKFH